MKKKDQRNNKNKLSFLVMILSCITIITTALSMAKYSISQSSEQLASVSSTKFIFSSNLISGGTTNGATITDDELEKSFVLLSDAYIPFHVVNFETANATTNVNEETINFQISVSGNLIIEEHSGGSVEQITSEKSDSFSAGVKGQKEYQIVANGTIPGTYEGTVVVESTSPYVKHYERNISITLKDMEIEKQRTSQELSFTFQNGIQDKTVVLEYKAPVYFMNVATTGVEQSETEDGITKIKTRTMVFPPGVKAQIMFRSTQGGGAVPQESDVTVTIK